MNSRGRAKRGHGFLTNPRSRVAAKPCRDLFRRSAAFTRGGIPRPRFARPPRRRRGIVGVGRWASGLFTFAPLRGYTFSQNALVVRPDQRASGECGAAVRGQVVLDLARSPIRAPNSNRPIRHVVSYRDHCAIRAVTVEANDAGAPSRYDRV